LAYYLSTFLVVGGKVLFYYNQEIKK